MRIFSTRVITPATRSTLVDAATEYSVEATQLVQDYCNRNFFLRTIEQVIDIDNTDTCKDIYLLTRPIQDIISVEHDNTPVLYIRGDIVIRPMRAWPIGMLTVRYQCGYPNNAIPPVVVKATLLQTKALAGIDSISANVAGHGEVKQESGGVNISNLYTTPSRTYSGLPILSPNIKRMLDPYRVVEL